MPTRRFTAVAAHTGDARQAELWSLALQAVAIPHDVVHDLTDWQIMVADRDEEPARRQISAIEQENRSWPPAMAKIETTAASRGPLRQPPTILLMGSLLVFHIITGPWTSHSPWFVQGAIAGRRILAEGEWWRLLTALTLHADPVHLMGNILIGGFLIHFLCLSLGSGLAWLSLLLAGTAGNYINILLHGNAHNSVGFSTAVFGTIGIMTGLRCIDRERLSAREIMMPLAAGAALLAILGTGGNNTDLGAHLWGFISGIILGLGLAILPKRQQVVRSPLLQGLFFILALAMLAVSWQTAMG